MPAYSFKQQFVPLIQDGSKRQTIRGKRKGQAKPGSTVYLYYGMRTKWCTKIGEAECKKVDDIVIKANGDVFLNGKQLKKWDKDWLAWNDGFRRDDMPAYTVDCFEIMFRWWKQTNGLPFEGDVIYWGDLKK